MRVTKAGGLICNFVRLFAYFVLAHKRVLTLSVCLQAADSSAANKDGNDRNLHFQFYRSPKEVRLFVTGKCVHACICATKMCSPFCP